jgi:hypothetical protein
LQVFEPGRHEFVVQLRENDGMWADVAAIPLLVLLAPAEESLVS